MKRKNEVDEHYFSGNYFKDKINIFTDNEKILLV